VFTEIINAGFDVLTYFKGAWARSATTAFSTVQFTAPDGAAHTYELAERLIDLPVPARPQAGGQAAKPAASLTLRLIVRCRPGGHQTPILTNRTNLRAAQIAYRMAARRRQKGYFKYACEHFALDALDSYANQSDDPTRMVPNPAKARAGDQISDARASWPPPTAASPTRSTPQGFGPANQEAAARPASTGPPAKPAPAPPPAKPRPKRLPAIPPATYPSGRSGPAASC